MKTLILSMAIVFFLLGCTVGKPEIKVNEGRVSVVCPLSQASFQDVKELADIKGLKWYKFNVKNMNKVVSYYNSLSEKAKINPDFIGIFISDADTNVYMIIVEGGCVIDAGTISMNALDVLLNGVPI